MGDELAEAVKSNLTNLYKQMTGNEIGTEAIKTALSEACKINDQIYAYATGVKSPPADGSEWVFDVTGLLYDNDGYLKRTVLVA